MCDQKLRRVGEIASTVMRVAMAAVLCIVLAKEFRILFPSQKITETRGTGGVRCFTYKESISCVQEERRVQYKSNKDQARDI